MVFSTQLEGREECDLVTDLAQPVVARVIGSFMGLDPEDDKPWADAINTLLGFGDPEINPGGIDQLVMEHIPPMYEKCMKLVAAAGPSPPRHDQRARLRDRRRHVARDLEIFAGSSCSSPPATIDKRQHDTMRALMENPDQRDLLARRSVARAVRRRGGAADVPGVRALPPHRDKDTELGGCPIKKGDKVAHVVPLL